MESMLDLPHLGSDPCEPFPLPVNALKVPNGLLAWGGDLHPDRLLAAYRQGIFPWYTRGQPILWWSPAPRCVIFPGNIHVSRRTRRRQNSRRYVITADQAFTDVIKECAQPRDYESGTWITDEMRSAYIKLHDLGHAHSVEVWEGAQLIGGIYGLAIGAVFFGESMFSRQVDASKIALIALCRHLVHCSFDLLDCQIINPHLVSMGAVEITREKCEKRLLEGVLQAGKTCSWAGDIHAGEPW